MLNVDAIEEGCSSPEPSSPMDNSIVSQDGVGGVVRLIHSASASGAAAAGDEAAVGDSSFTCTVMKWAVPGKKQPQQQQAPGLEDGLSASPVLAPTGLLSESTALATTLSQVSELVEGREDDDTVLSASAMAKAQRRLRRDLHQVKALLKETALVGGGGEAAEDVPKKRVEKEVRNGSVAGEAAASTTNNTADTTATSSAAPSPRSTTLGTRIYETIMSMAQASSLGDGMGEEEEATRTASTEPSRPQHSEPVDRRPDAAPTPIKDRYSNPTESSSVFFHSSASLKTSRNLVKEVILSLGRAAQTDDELCWLFRHSSLLCFLPRQALQTVVKASLRREYSKGETILEESVDVQHLYVVVWGEVDAFEVPKTQVSIQLGSNSPTARLEHPQYLNHNSRHGIRQGTLSPGQVFGVEQCVFDGHNPYSFRASVQYEKTVVSLVPYGVVRQLLSQHIRFAQSVGDAVTAAVDVFKPIREFCRSVFSVSTAENEYLPLWTVVERYTRLDNVIHTKMAARELDTGAWGYALNRLPANVTTTFCFNLVHALPPFVASRMRLSALEADVRKQADRNGSHSRSAIAFVQTKERRRCTWNLGMDGKTLVLLRDGFTDLLDFITMMCAHIIESNKLRGRLQGMVHPPAIDILDDYLQQRETEKREGCELSEAEELERMKGVLQHMPLMESERDGLLRLWGVKTALTLYEIMMHREEYNVRVDLSVSRRFQTNPFHEWALNLRACVLNKIGLKAVDTLPEDLYIDVVSSNTHCIKNLLSSFNRKYKDEILQYARENESVRLAPLDQWHQEDDILYAAQVGFLKRRPDLKEEFTKSLEANGITVITDTAMTGLQVDVIPVHGLQFDTIDRTILASIREWYRDVLHDDAMVDAVCRASSSPVYSSSLADTTGSTPSEMSELNTPETSYPRLKRHFIINMDFAFGAQAEGICRAVFSAFGHRIRSVSVMGKAGGLGGKRGDIQLASHVLMSKSSFIVEDNQDELRDCRNTDFKLDRLRKLAGPHIAVHHGNVLTVTGTMLQNVKLLRYYQRVWSCVGTEMEGSYFARVIEDFHQQGITRPDMISRFAYYSSDLPLAASDAEEGDDDSDAATLSSPMTPIEGVPPLYAIARGILERILLP